MRKIKDERLILQNLKNIRVAFLVQSVGIIAILLYDVITKGLSAMTDNPLWSVFMVTVIILTWLNMRISVDVYDDAKKKKPEPYYWGVLVSMAIGIVLALLSQSGPDNNSISGALIVGSITFVCFLAPYSYIYYLRKKRAEDS
ncbi:hypothetical protein [Lentibacillus sp. CBA3610]|uniref:hypothetical protein n=1 Tax=Lentibacillus sp. CBA3610 TaxID=2518176 RepID=UPI001595CCC5|nr:hypothetical protein [Lentibacillus sp. CBA3610]QKY68808.1 hypothetical protein Len3610_03510 [Lentibacillus sp. CBA3610]